MLYLQWIEAHWGVPSANALDKCLVLNKPRQWDLLLNHNHWLMRPLHQKTRNPTTKWKGKKRAGVAIVSIRVGYSDLICL